MTDEQQTDRGWHEAQGDDGPTTNERADSTGKAFDASNAADPGPGRNVDADSADGVSDTDMNPSGPHGVGESASRRGEGFANAPGADESRYDTGTQGPSERPTGESNPEDWTGVDPQSPSTGSPDVSPGDQGG